MMPLTLSHLVAVLTRQPSIAAITDLQMPISTVVVDSRQVEPGVVFVALPGERTDGHSFVTDALRRGAVAAIVEQDVVSDAE